MNQRASVHIFIILLLMNGISIAQNLQFKWATQVSSEIQVNSIAIDAHGNMYATGIFSGSPDFDPSTSVYTLSDKGFGDIFVSKTDPSGKLLWVKNIGGISYDEGMSIALDAQGNSYIAGFYSSDSIDFDGGADTFLMSALSSENSFVLKLDTDGNFIWSRQIKSDSENYARSISLDKQNNVVVTGRFEGTADFDPLASITNISAVINAIYIWKLDMNGTYMWAKKIETLATRSHAVATDGLGNIFVTGYMGERTDFDPSDTDYYLSPTSTKGGSQFMFKLNAEGDFLWAKNIENVDMVQNDRSVVSDSIGNTYYYGYLLGNVDFDPSIGVHTILPSIGNDHYLLQITSNGEFGWVHLLSDVKGIALDSDFNIYTCGNNIQKYDATGNTLWVSSHSLSSKIAIDSFDNIYTTGTYTGTFDFDPDSTIYILSSNENTSTFIQKLSQSIILGDNEIVPLDNNLRIYPNPNNGEFQVVGKANGAYILYNAMGTVMMNIHLSADDIYKNDTPLPDGLYYLQNRSGNHKSFKVIIKH